MSNTQQSVTTNPEFTYPIVGGLKLKPTIVATPVKYKAAAQGRAVLAYGVISSLIFAITFAYGLGIIGGVSVL